MGPSQLNAVFDRPFEVIVGQTANARTVRDVRVLLISMLLCIACLSLSRSVGDLVAHGAWRLRRAFIISLPPAILFGLVAAALVLWGMHSSFARHQFGAWVAAGAAISTCLAVLWWGVTPAGALSELLIFAPQGAVCGAGVGAYGYLEAKGASPRVSARA
jgi:hypothetical protein